MPFTNGNVNIEALVRTVRTMLADAAHPLSALDLSGTTLTNWHKLHGHLHDPSPIVTIFHDRIIINPNSISGTSPVRNRNRVRTAPL